MAVIIILLVASLSAFANGKPEDIEHLKNDFVIHVRSGNPGQRLAGFSVLGNSKDLKCDIVRRNITTFGYCYNDEFNQKLGIDTTKYRGWVREVVSQWEKCGGIKIVEEKACRQGPDFVTITIGEYHPVVYPYVDKNTCKVEAFRMFLDFYTTEEVGQGYRASEKKHKAVLQAYALHEFGHFLGFDHEHNRADKGPDAASCSVDDTVGGPNPVFGTYNIGTYDRDSVMNYCRKNFHVKPWLSEGDKQQVAQAYRPGNKKECDAATKHWKWSKGEGLDDTRVKELEIEETKGFDACEDLIEDCADRIVSCGDQVMQTYYCKRSCGKCPK